MNTENLLLVMVGIAGAAVLLQALVLLGIYIAMVKAMKTAKSTIDELHTSIMPLLHTSKEVAETTKDMMSRLGPRLDAAASDLEEMVQIARDETARFQESAEEINQRVRHQAARVDDMTTSVLNGVDRAGRFMNEAVNLPIRQVSGIVAAMKAVVETLRTPAPPRRGANEPRTAEEKDMFV